MKYRKNYQKFLSDLVLLLLLIVITVIVTIIYLSHERYFYFWDYSNYANQTSDLAAAFRISKFQGISLISSSLVTEYNKVPCLPLIPFILIFGDSRLVYILSCVLVYIVPFCLVMGAIAIKVVPPHSRAVFWSTAFLTLLLPPTWVSTLRGYPDIGGSVIIGLAILVYFKDIYLRQWWQICLLGFLLAFSIIFRRHFAYSVIAFLISLFLQAFVIFGPITKDSFKHKRVSQKPIIYIGSIALILIEIFGIFLVIIPVVLYKTFATDYSSLYEAYKKSVIDNYIYYGKAFGWFPWLLAIFGFFPRVLTTSLNQNHSIFIVILGFVAWLQWGLLPGYLGLHYTTQYIFFVAIGSASAIWFIALKLKSTKRYCAVVTLIIMLTINQIIGLTFIKNISDFHKSLVWTANNPPLFRNDYNEVVRLINQLRELAPHNESIYIVNSGSVLNSSLVREAEKQLYGKNILNIVESPDIDARDFYPLYGLLQADYIVVANRSSYNQFYNQKVVQFVFKIFHKNSNVKSDFLRDFKILPEKFKLEKNLDFQIYKRLRSTSLSIALNTLKIMQDYITTKPFRENFWLTISQNRGGRLFTHKQGLINIEANVREKPVFFLYFGLLPKTININGILKIASCQGSDRVSLRFSTLNSEGKTIKSQEFVYPSQSAKDLTWSVSSEQADYLLLELAGYNHSQKNAYCSVHIKNLEIK